jgi:hypothetical protein
MAYTTSANNRFLNQPVTTTATNYTVQLSDVIIEVTNTAAVRTITLPAPSLTGNIGKAFFIKDTSGGASLNNIILAPASGTIDGAVNTSIVTNYGSIQVFCDGTSYYTYGYTSGSNSLAIVERVFTSSGTYTPTVGMIYCEVQIVGGGGGGGGSTATGGAQCSGGGGGGSGEYALGLFSAATIGAAQAITIGTAGAANSGAAGGVGGTTSLSSLMTAVGGPGGTSSAAGANFGQPGTLGGTGGTGGNLRVPGRPGSPSNGSVVGVILVAGEGGSSFLGSGGIPTGGAGNAALGYGSGGSGTVNFTSGAAIAGGAGSAGVVIIQEYVTQQVTTLPVVALAKAAWNRQSITPFTPGSTTVNVSFVSDPGTVASNAGSRIDLSSLTQTEGFGITISQFQATITQAGTYQIIFNATLFLGTGSTQNDVMQCVKNGSTIIGLGIVWQFPSGPSAGDACFTITAEFAVGDTIDFRANTAQPAAFQFFAISASVIQLPSTTIVPVTAWVPVSGTSQSLSINTGYVTQNASLTTCTLPVTAAFGTLISLSGIGAGGWIVAQNTGQFINFGNQVTTTGTGGSIASTNRYDGIDLLCVVANTQWTVRMASGNLTVV